MAAAHQQPMMMAAPQAMNFFVANKQYQHKMMMTEFTRRAFTLPAHVKLEMPNLSPTMEKVRLYTEITI
jgi:hypothetical protein